MRIEYEDTCMVTCSDTGRTVKSEVLSFSPEHVLSVSVGRSVKVNMTWSPKTKVYVGNMAGMEFTSRGPNSSKYQAPR